MAHHLVVTVSFRAIEPPTVPDFVVHCHDCVAGSVEALWTLTRHAFARRNRISSGKGTGVVGNCHDLARHGRSLREIGGNRPWIDAKGFQHGVFVAYQPFLDDLSVLDQAMRNRPRNPIAAGRRTVGPVAKVGAGLEHPMRADEAHRAALLPHHVLTGPATAVWKCAHLLDAVGQDVVEIVRLAVCGVDLDVARIVLAEPPQPALDPDLVSPAQDVVARIAEGCVSGGIEIGERIESGHDMLQIYASGCSKVADRSTLAKAGRASQDQFARIAALFHRQTGIVDPRHQHVDCGVDHRVRRLPDRRQVVAGPAPGRCAIEPHDRYVAGDTQFESVAGLVDATYRGIVVGADHGIGNLAGLRDRTHRRHPAIVSKISRDDLGRIDAGRAEPFDGTRNALIANGGILGAGDDGEAPVPGRAEPLDQPPLAFRLVATDAVDRQRIVGAIDEDEREAAFGQHLDMPFGKPRRRDHAVDTILPELVDDVVRVLLVIEREQHHGQAALREHTVEGPDEVGIVAKVCNDHGHQVRALRRQHPRNRVGLVAQ